jgi:hypothetical protein
MRNGLATLACGAGLLVAGPALAADIVMPGPAPEAVVTDSGWTFAAAPYLWMAGIEGDIAQFGLPAISVDATFADILDNFDFGFMGAAEARYGRFGILTDVMYVKVSADAPTPFGVLADGVDVTSETFSMLAAGSYRLLESDQGHLDVLGGGRLWYVNTEVDLVNPIVPAPAFEDGDTWVDPIVGVQGRANLTPEVFLTGWAMIGGFGAASDLTWDLMGGAGYAINDTWSIIGGYRALSVDYEDDGFLFDVVQHGPFLGARISF